MYQHTPADLAHAIAYLERCLTVLSEVAMASSDIVFLQTFLTHAKGYLSGDLSPDTEAVANWHTPENQAMIRRYITHVKAEIRLVIAAWQQAHPDDLHTAAGMKLQAIAAGLEPLCDKPSNLTGKASKLESKGSRSCPA